MAQTARDTISRAMRMLGVIMGGAVTSSVEAANGLIALNSMMHGWKGQGVDIGHVDLALSDNLDLADHLINGCTALLAVELSPEFTVPIPQAVGLAAAGGWSAIQAAYITDTADSDMTVETGLRRLSANNRGRGTYRG
jgi:hypothetical protein